MHPDHALKSIQQIGHTFLEIRRGISDTVRHSGRGYRNPTECIDGGDLMCLASQGHLPVSLKHIWTSQAHRVAQGKGWPPALSRPCYYPAVVAHYATSTLLRRSHNGTSPMGHPSSDTKWYPCDVRRFVLRRPFLDSMSVKFKGGFQRLNAGRWTTAQTTPKKSVESTSEKIVGVP